MCNCDFERAAEVAKRLERYEFLCGGTGADREGNGITHQSDRNVLARGQSR